jgi:hypothetical protein
MRWRLNNSRRRATDGGDTSQVAGYRYRRTTLIAINVRPAWNLHSANNAPVWRYLMFIDIWANVPIQGVNSRSCI